LTVTICDVCPRDGLQNEKTTLDPATRAELVDLLAAAGVPRIEAVSFVNPARVPQMAGAEKVVAAIEREPGCRASRRSASSTRRACRRWRAPRRSWPGSNAALLSSTPAWN
jgi:isopropylmalate/homocitrate/citramalate synthase